MCIITDSFSISEVQKARKLRKTLDAAVQDLLFPPDGKYRIASEDSCLFVAVMDEFIDFEIVSEMGCVLTTDVHVAPHFHFLIV